ncbi:7721_t:CDS:2 [Funneliformis caledonium]|uniref:7721_t:CDS:1 n=1 Tax=Funneliformis caledonium TaxID=1117310 RepID=A0A9N9FHJ7_9GLOM|nr:7721_t:CDS:2 [Funneliformis caledonium]
MFSLPSQPSTPTMSEAVKDRNVEEFVKYLKERDLGLEGKEKLLTPSSSIQQRLIFEVLVFHFELSLKTRKLRSLSSYNTFKDFKDILNQFNIDGISINEIKQFTPARYDLVELERCIDDVKRKLDTLTLYLQMIMKQK